MLWHFNDIFNRPTNVFSKIAPFFPREKKTPIMVQYNYKHLCHNEFIRAHLIRFIFNRGKSAIASFSRILMQMIKWRQCQSVFVWYFKTSDDLHLENLINWRVSSTTWKEHNKFLSNTIVIKKHSINNQHVSLHTHVLYEPNSRESSSGWVKNVIFSQNILCTQCNVNLN